MKRHLAYDMINQKEFLAAIKSTVHSFDDAAEVILFGSRARGDYEEDSDWDILVLTDRKVDTATEWAMIDSMFELEMKYAQVISLLIDDKASWNYWEIRPVNKNVAREGLPL